MGADGSGTVSRAEFNHSQTPELMENIGIDRQITNNAFDILDRDRDGELKSKEFIDMICKCLHDPTSEDILEMDTLVDNIAEVLGLGRDRVAVLQKDIERMESRMSRMSSKSTTDQAFAPQLSLHHFDKATTLLTIKARASVRKSLKPQSPNQNRMSVHAKNEMAIDRLSSLYNVSERMEQLRLSVGDVLLATEAGKLSPVPKEDASDLLMLEDGQANVGDRSEFWSGGIKVRSALPLPSAGMMTILRPALRALHARLHALRSECKIAGMSFDGNILYGQEWQPLDELITEVLKCLEIATVAIKIDDRCRTSVMSQYDEP